MAGRQAKVLAPAALNTMLRYVKRHHTDPLRSTVMSLLSVRAGLRAAEIAKLEWSMVLTARGSISDSIAVPHDIAKKGNGRRVPMRADLRRNLALLWRHSNNIGPVVTSARGGHMRSNSIVNWFIALYKETRPQRLLVTFWSANMIARFRPKRNRHGRPCGGHPSIDETQSA